MTTGIISALNRPVSTSRVGDSTAVIDAIQTDAAINPGNSGGALVNARGALIGINTAIATLGGSDQNGEAWASGSIGLGFAIPIDQAMRVADQPRKTGKAQHPSLGVSVGPASTTDPTQSGPASPRSCRGRGRGGEHPRRRRDSHLRRAHDHQRRRPGRRGAIIRTGRQCRRRLYRRWQAPDGARHPQDPRYQLSPISRSPMATSAFDETTRDETVADAVARELSASDLETRGTVTARALVVVVADDHLDSGGLGALVGELLEEADFHVDATVVVSGDEVEIRNALNTAVIGGVDVVISVGGVGVRARDVTPEATEPCSTADCPASRRRSALPDWPQAPPTPGCRAVSQASPPDAGGQPGRLAPAVRDGMATITLLAHHVIEDITEF